MPTGPEPTARSLADALAAIRLVAPHAELETLLGDQAIFEAVLAALGLPRGWQKKLARAFGNPGQLKALLARPFFRPPKWCAARSSRGTALRRAMKPRLAAGA